MGAYPHDSKDLEGMWFNDAKFPHGFTNVIGESFKYNSDWNWLMSVVEKIESLEFDFAIYTGSCVSIINTKDFPYDEIINLNGTSKIESVYNACIDFIKYYNENSAEIKN